MYSGIDRQRSDRIDRAQVSRSSTCRRCGSVLTGNSDADLAVATQAVSNGARMITHLFKYVHMYHTTPSERRAD
jgi:hypothetical protein